MASADETAPAWFITGCSTGLGRALAEPVLHHGYHCAVTARDPARVQAIVAPHPGRALALSLEVTHQVQLEQAVAHAEAAFGSIDVLVNNAGYGYNAAVEEGDDGVLRAMFDTNFFRLAALIRCVLPSMRARGHGHIINISAAGGLAANAGSRYYSACDPQIFDPALAGTSKYS